MPDLPKRHRRPSRAVIAWRIGRTILAIVALQAIVCGAALLPVVFAWQMLPLPAHQVVRLMLVSVAIVPSYVAFAVCLLATSAMATRLCGLRTPADTEMRIADMSGPLLRWVHYLVATHLVRMLAGPLFRGTPIWTWYLRLNGARLGRRVYINSLAISDHNLLEFGDDVVIGDGVHLSGHTVEAGVVRTGRVCVGHDVTIGLGSVISIGVDIEPHVQIGALSLVPKHTRVTGPAVYVGIPIRAVTKH